MVNGRQMEADGYIVADIEEATKEGINRQLYQ